MRLADPETHPMTMHGTKLRNQERVTSLLILACFGVLAVYFTGVFSHYTSANEISRVETIYSAVEFGTFQIDRALPVLGNHEDKSTFQARFYSNKAPGLALAAIPLYRLLRVLFPPPVAADNPVLVVLRILVVSGVCLFALARYWRRMVAIHGSLAPLLVLALAFGTPYLYYARSFYSHAWTASLLFLSWDLLKSSDEEGALKNRLPRLGFLAGILASWAAISEYPAAVIAALLFLRSLTSGPIEKMDRVRSRGSAADHSASCVQRGVFWIAVGTLIIS